jgi:hypothetical protein
MSELSDKARALARSGRTAFRPTDGDRARVSAALRSRLGAAALPRVATPAAIVWPRGGAALLGDREPERWRA